MQTRDTQTAVASRRRLPLSARAAAARIDFSILF